MTGIVQIPKAVPGRIKTRHTGWRSQLIVVPNTLLHAFRSCSIRSIAWLILVYSSLQVMNERHSYVRCLLKPRAVIAQ